MRAFGILFAFVRRKPGPLSRPYPRCFPCPLFGNLSLASSPPPPSPKLFSLRPSCGGYDVAKPPRNPS